MKPTRLLTIAVFTAATVAEQLKVEQYEGPTECEEADVVKVGDLLRMHYTGTIDKYSTTGVPGTKFDSSRDRDVVLERTIGVGELIQGWDQGLLGLCEGAKATLVVPPELGYGSKGAGDFIPGNATLHFDVEVISISAPPPLPNLFEELDVDHDGLLSPAEILTHFQREGPNAAMPPGLMEKDDINEDGFVSREEYGGPRMDREMCLEMLWNGMNFNSEPTALGLAVQWLCQREQPVPNGRARAKEEL